MQQKIFQIDAFTSELFSGNPAIVCPLEQWFDDQLMQKIAAESGLTCVFFVGAIGHYQIRWFTPRAEIQGICGHGTIAAGYVILNDLGDTSDEVVFRVPAGERLRWDPRFSQVRWLARKASVSFTHLPW